MICGESGLLATIGLQPTFGSGGLTGVSPPSASCRPAIRNCDSWRLTGRRYLGRHPGFTRRRARDERMYLGSRRGGQNGRRGCISKPYAESGAPFPQYLHALGDRLCRPSCDLGEGIDQPVPKASLHANDPYLASGRCAREGSQRGSSLGIEKSRRQ